MKPPLKVNHNIKLPLIVNHNIEESEFEKLKSRAHTRPYWFRVNRMHLTPAERDSLSYTINKSSDLAKEGYYWKRIGDAMYTIQMISSALVPVLIGIVGTFETPQIDILIRVFAIIISISGTIVTAFENVHNFKERGQSRVNYADSMNSIFQVFDSRSGDFSNLNDKDALHMYMNTFNIILENARKDSFIGQYRTQERTIVV